MTVLNEIVSSERFEPVETENLGSLHHQSTHHHHHAQSQGLDWDYVFCRFAKTFPTVSGYLPDQFLGDFTLAEVARAQIRAALTTNLPYQALQRLGNRQNT